MNWSESMISSPSGGRPGGGVRRVSDAEHPPPTPPSRAGSLRFAGYAALFAKADAASDVISQGAFEQTLRQRTGPLPLYWQHKPDQRIGWIERVSEDERGLQVIGQIDNPDGRAASLLQSRAVDGLSFGYRARRFRKTGNGRQLDEVELFEISLVTHPLQHEARVHLIIPPALSS